MTNPLKCTIRTNPLAPSALKQYNCASSTPKSPYMDIGATINWASLIDHRLSKEFEGQLEIP